MKILITGGAGFIGTNLINQLLLNTSHEIICIDKLTYASNNFYKFFIDKYSESFKFIKADICDESLMHDLICDFKPNRIMHLAAESHVDNSINNPGVFITTNILGTVSLLKASQSLLDKKIASKSNFLFHHISTDEVFGDLDESEDPFHENSVYKPSSPYSASKASSDHFVKAWNRTFELPTIITNCSNNFGPHQHAEKLIPKIIYNMFNNLKVPVYGNGLNIRDWLFVEDHADALILCMENGINGETYNIGANNELTNLEVFSLIAEGMAEVTKQSEDELMSMLEFVDDRKGHDRRYAINSSKIQNQFNWTPRHTFATGLMKTILFYLEVFKRK